MKSGAIRKFAKRRYSRCSGSSLGVEAVVRGPVAGMHRWAARALLPSGALLLLLRASAPVVVRASAAGRADPLVRW